MSEETGNTAGWSSDTEVLRPVLRETDGSALDRLYELLGESCELPIARLAELAQEHGVAPHQLLGEAEQSSRCWVDYNSGHIRCQDAEE